MVLDEFFPLPELGLGSPFGERERQSRPSGDDPHKAMSATRTREGSSELRSGQSFLIYSSQDILGALPDDYAKLVQRASRWTGVDDNYILGVVERYERRLVRWWRSQRKADDLDDSVWHFHLLSKLCQVLIIVLSILFRHDDYRTTRCSLCTLPSWGPQVFTPPSS